METGPFFSGTIVHPPDPALRGDAGRGSVTLKGLVVRVGERGEGSVCYDTDLIRASAGWTGDFLRFNPARFGLISPQTAAGKAVWLNPALPGWSGVDAGFNDPRPRKPNGPLPRDWAHYRGLRRHGRRIVLEYTVGETLVRESPWIETVDGLTFLTRTFEIAPSERPHSVLICPAAGAKGLLVLPEKSSGSIKGLVTLKEQSDVQVAVIAPHSQTVRFKVLIGPALPAEIKAAAVVAKVSVREDLTALCQPGPALWRADVVTQGVVSQEQEAYVVDTLTLPFENPYKAMMFCSGHDFFSSGDAAVCTVHGDVWLVRGIDGELKRLKWKRFATGLFQPLGLKIVNDQVYVLGRDQITRLRDENQDGEADFYENFNNDGQITANAHEFAACLETDRAGNFYYLRGDSNSQTDHDGCLLRVSPDGAKVSVFATGIRNGNGLSVGPDDVVTFSPQEGHWTPGSAIFVAREGGFYGATQSHHRSVVPKEFEPPLCWIPRLQDNSSGGQAWVPPDCWGPLAGRLLHFSFGTCRMFHVLRDNGEGGGQAGGTVQWPMAFDSGIMRGRFSPKDGQLYVTGLKGWVSSAVRDGCFQRVRYTGAEVDLPIGVRTYRNGIALTFTRALDRTAAEDLDNYALQQWNYRWSADYGSPELRASRPQEPGRDDVEAQSATLLPDGRTVFLELPRWKPVMQLAVGYTLKSADGRAIKQTANLTIQRTGSDLFPEDQIHRQGPTVTAEDEIDLVPGIEMRFRLTGSKAGGWADARTSRLAALSVEADGSPSPFLPAGPFEMQAEGFIQVPLKGKYRFALAGSGTGELLINGRKASSLEGVQPAPAAMRLEAANLDVALHRGLNRIRLNYRSPDAAERGGAAVRVFWSGEAFATESLPPTVLFSTLNSVPLERGTDLREGRAAVLEQGCLRCHAAPADFDVTALAKLRRQTAPELSSLKSRVRSAWVYHWLFDPWAVRHEATMPGMFSSDRPADRQSAADIAALLAAAAPAEVDPAVRSELAAKGGILFENLGCIACHRFTPPAEQDEFARVSLHFTRAKFLPGKLADFLRKPHADFAASRMPDFHLTEAEVESLDEYVRSQSKGEFPAPPAGDGARGEQALRSARCLQCHPRGGLKPAEATLPLADLHRGCLAERGAVRGTAPNYPTSIARILQTRLLLAGDLSSIVRAAPVEDGAALHQTLRCQACHSRDDRPAQLPIIASEQGDLGLSPEQFPGLTWTGERLHRSWLTDFIAGKVTERPRPWLRGRMPSFPAYAERLSHGFIAEHGILPESLTLKPDAKLAEVGRRLAERDGGLDCRQCHAIGNRAATGDKGTQIALGINFAQIGRRLRPEFYHRIVLDPPRFDSGSRMPILVPDGRRTAVTGVLDGDAHKQFEALWHFILSTNP